MIKAIFFDLDGTLLPIDEKLFVSAYFPMLYEKVKNFGYERQSFTDNIWKATKLMYANDGSRTNKEVFWDYFVGAYGQEVLKQKGVFEDFYANEFKGLQSVCKENPYAKDIVRFCKEKFGQVLLTTNPIFPKVGTLTRMAFAGLKEEDFDYISTYENSCFSKPNPEYFKDILRKFSLESDEVILIGNNEEEDGECASAAGIKTYMTAILSLKSKQAGRSFPHIPMSGIIDLLKKYVP